MFAKLLLAFTLVPVIEIYLLVEVGSVIGAWNTVALVIVTGAAGAWLARTQGLATLTRIQEKTRSGGLPGDELVEGFLILVAGVVLLTPGLATDAAGLLLLVPPVRARLRALLMEKFKEWSAKGAAHIYTAGPHGFTRTEYKGPNGFTRTEHPGPHDVTRTEHSGPRQVEVDVTPEPGSETAKDDRD